MSKKSYKLLTTAIVTAVNPSNPTAIGAVWTPEQRNDVLEAEALVRVGMAEESSDKATVETVDSVNAKRKAETGEEGPRVSGVAIDAIKQGDGTFRNSFGIQVNEDGTEYDANAKPRTASKTTK
ncbi:MAG TPA: hypothetical protein VF680_17410 [Allosphingosinicella sp.]|jgi:hypothetical protein